MLFVAVFSVPLILGSWLVHYLDVDEGLATAAAGALSFVMFGVSPLPVRPVERSRSAASAPGCSAF